MNLENDGAPLFAAAIEADGRSQGDIGAELGMSQQKVSLILKMRSVPTEVERILIELLFGVPRDSWLTRDEQRRIQDMRATLIRAGKRPAAAGAPSLGAR